VVGDSDLPYLTYETINLNKLIDSNLNGNIGGTVIFLGTVRDYDNQEAKFLGLYYEAYESMAEEEFLAIETEARQKWNIMRIVVTHRLGRVKIGETSVAIIVSSRHRKEAFDACQFIIDNIKKRVPIWKLEITSTGQKWLSGTLLLPRKK
jgi:molybdopterin synthase catalytic subunit